MNNWFSDSSGMQTRLHLDVLFAGEGRQPASKDAGQ
jgi:hypothetical protein